MEDTLFDLEEPVNTSIISKPIASTQALLASGNHPTPQFNRPALDPPAIDKPVIGISSALQDDVIAAATAVVTMFTKCKEQGRMIDTDLLIKILTNPKMTEKLINDRQAPGGTAPEPLSESKPVTELVPFPCSKPAIELEPMPANENMCYLPKRLQYSMSPQDDSFPVSRSKQAERPSLNSSPLLPGTVQSSKSSPANVNMSTRLDELLSALNSRPPQLDNIPDCSPKSFSLQVPTSPSLEVDMPASQQKLVNNLYPSCSVPQSSLSAMHCREPLVPLSGFSDRSSVIEPRVLPPSPRDGNLHNIIKGVQPALNTRSKSDILPSPPFIAIKSRAKDANYYKTLIKLHGGERQGTPDQIITLDGNHENYLQGLEHIQHLNPTELTHKSVKSCIFFNSPTGCRFGANCHYQHDPFSKWLCGGMLEDNWTKRMKLDGKFTSRK